MLVIPFAELGKDTLLALLEEIVTRDGTDYGMVEIPTSAKVRQALQQLQAGHVCLCYDNESQTCNLLPAEEARRFEGQADACCLPAGRPRAVLPGTGDAVAQENP